MKHVSAKFLSLLFCSSLLLTACEDPSVEMGTLGKKLAAPSLKGTSPFDQDVDTLNYAHIQGSCDTRVGNISVSFDNVNFHIPAASPDLTDTSLSNITNDTSCADGSFDFYLTKADLANTWGVVIGNTDVNNIYLKGDTLIGETKTLVLTDPKSSSGSGTATNLAIFKVWPSGFGGIGQCEMFNVVVQDANGNETSTSSAASFSITSSGGSGSSNISGYTSWTDCSNSTNEVSSFSVPAKQSNLSIYYRIPSGTSEQVLTFGLKNSSLITNQTTTVQTRDPSGGRRWIALQDSPTSVYKDVCYAATLRRMTYTKSSASDTESLQIALTSSNSKLKFYSSSNCSSAEEITSVTFAGYATDAVVYAKYNSSSTDTSTISKVSISYTTSNTNYDITSFPLRVDTTSASTASKIDFWGPESTNRGVCNAYTVVTANSNWTPVPASAAITVDLASTISGSFYSDQYCTGTAMTSLSIPAGGSLSKVYFKATPAAATSGTITLSSAGLTSSSRTVAVSLTATGASLALYSGTAITKDQCAKVKLSYVDSVGTIPSVSPITFVFNSSNSLSSAVHYYADSTSCATGTGETTTMTLSPDGLYFYFYLKVDSAFTDTYLYLYLSGGPTTNVGTTFTVSP